MPVLEGIRVIDASRILAGPHCGQMLADNGAEVIKIEPPDGDQNRNWPPIAGDTGTNYLSVNRGKEAITLNLKLPKGQEILHHLVGESDVFLQNFLPSVTAKLGCDYETLKRFNPDVIYVSISGYGAKGPLRNHPGFGQMLAAFTGVMSLTGEHDGPPLSPGVPFVDMSTGMLAYAGVVSALLARATGKARGQRVDVSLMETTIALLGPSALSWLVAGKVPHREGAGNAKMAPYGPYHCQDGDIMIGAPNDGAWRKLCHALDAASLADDPRFLNNTQRTANRAALREALEGILRRAPVKHWFEHIAKAGVACAPINAVDQVLSDEHVLANEMVVEAPKRDGGTMRLLGLPLKLSATPGRPGRAPPALGEDTSAVLQRILHLDSGTLDGLHNDGVI